MNFSCHLYDVSVWRIFSSRWYHPSPTFWVGCRKSFGNRGRLRSFLLTILYTKMMKMRMIAIWFFDEMLGDTVAESSKWQKKTNPYRSMDYIAATSNIVERLFSRCGVIMRPHRCLMDPSTIEMLITSNGPDYPRYHAYYAQIQQGLVGYTWGWYSYEAHLFSSDVPNTPLPQSSSY